MDWFNQFIVFSMGSGFFRWFGCWLLLVAPVACIASGIGGGIDKLIHKD